MSELKEKNIIVATHVYATGPAQDLREYLLKNKVGKLFFIGHPLFFDKKLKSSGYELFERGELKKETYGKIKKIPEPISYLKDIWLNIFWIIKSGKKWDMYVGSDNLNAFSGIILKKMGRVVKVVYYVIDYNPKRFSNKLLNSVYHWVDRFCVKNSDETWNLSPRMAKAREEYFHFSSGNQITVPIGVWYSRFPRLEFSQVEKHTLVFMGHILEKQGVQYVLDAIPAIIKELPDFKFLVIGGGEYLPTLKEQAEKLGIEKYVQFTGYVEKHSEVEKMLAKCACAIAMYEKYDQAGDLSFTYFADPGKIKSYLAGGLPILLSGVSHNAKEIERKRCGFVISNDKEEIAKKVIALLRNEEVLREYRKNALNYVREFDWEIIFKERLEKL